MHLRLTEETIEEIIKALGSHPLAGKLRGHLHNAKARRPKTPRAFTHPEGATHYLVEVSGRRYYYRPGPEGVALLYNWVSKAWESTMWKMQDLEGNTSCLKI